MARIALSEPVPAALAATQSFQSLECLFLSLFSLSAIPPGHCPPLATRSVYTRKYGSGVERGERAERSVARIVHACAVLTLADSPRRQRREAHIFSDQDASRVCK